MICTGSEFVSNFESRWCIAQPERARKLVNPWGTVPQVTTGDRAAGSANGVSTASFIPDASWAGFAWCSETFPRAAHKERVHPDRPMTGKSTPEAAKSVCRRTRVGRVRRERRGVGTGSVNVVFAPTSDGSRLCRCFGGRGHCEGTPFGRIVTRIQARSQQRLL